MKKITNNRTIVIVCLVLLIYCLSILIEKRITPNSGFDFKLWSPYYLIFAIIIPLAILLPIRFLPSSRYTNFILQKEKKINKIIVISTGIILIWLMLWYAMIAMGDLMDKSLKISEADTAALLKVDTSKIAILPYDKTEEWLFKDGSQTELNSKDIEEIETILTKCIAEYNREQEKQFREINSKHPEYKFDRNNFVIDLKRYKRQYIAVINKKGEKEVWINCFCSTWSANWKVQQIQVKDGGNCFFNLKINLKTKNYYDLGVNGDA